MTSSVDYTIRYARADELAALQQVELAAAQLFAEIGLDQVAEDDPLPLDFLREQQRLGLVWVAPRPVNRACLTRRTAFELLPQSH